MSFGKAQGRIEDARFLTGQGRYTDDIVPEGALHAAFLRSPVAHADVTGIDLSAALAVPGVRLVLDAAALKAAGVRLSMRASTAPNADGTRGASPKRRVLARHRLRFVGEPVAMVVADTAEAAQDGVEAIVLDYAERAAVVAMGQGEAIHPEAPGNLAYRYELGDGAAVDAAMAAAAHRVRLALPQQRVTAMAMEPRGAWAEWDGARLHLCTSGQGVWVQKDELARMLGLDAAAVRVTNPDVGGGFGMKGMPYPEYVPIAQAARMLGRPVRWVATRGESILSDNAARDLEAEAELAFDAGLRLTGYRCRVRANLGAYNSMFAQMIQSVLFSRVLTGAYDIPAAHLASDGFYTNTTPVDAYRGAGRPEAILTLECAMDHAARMLGVSPFDLRRRSLVRQFPYAMMNGETIMDGDFVRVLDVLERRADIAGFPARQAASAARGLLRGGGLGQYIESILGDPSETARMDLNPDGTLSLYVGTQSNGQGHETVFAQLLSDRTGVPVDRIRFVQGDSDLIPLGGGTGGSRSVTVQGTAILATVDAMTAAFEAFLLPELGPGTAFDPAQGTFGAPGTNLRLTLAEAAERARVAGRNDLLSHSATTRVKNRSFPNGAHWAEVEIDPDTGAVRVDRHVVVDDFGNLMSPMLVEGQVQGGIAQGWGQVMAEQVAYDAQGQVLSGSFMDYAMPRATDMPRPDWHSEAVPTATNPLGMKGCGEAGTVGALPALANAVADALAQRGVVCDMPFTPHRVWQALHGAD